MSLRSLFGFTYRTYRRRRRRRAGGTAEYRRRKEEARVFVHARLAHWNETLRLAQGKPFEFGSVRIKNQRAAWGSCSSKKNLNFNWRLVTLPPDLADYIVLHELCHTVHLNHSRDFWGLVATHAPDHRALRTRLRRYTIGTV